MNYNEVKNKLIATVKEMILANSDIKIPEELENQILKKHGWSLKKKNTMNENFNDFICTLIKWIDVQYVLRNMTQLKLESESTKGVYNELKEYTEAENNYVDSKLKIVPLLKETINVKEKYSEKFQNKCICQNVNAEIMFKKLEFLKLQFFYKLYEENNALQGHLKLENMLTKELDSLKKSYNDVIARNNQFDCIKNDPNYLNLFKLYKELKEVEKRAEIMKSI